MVTTTTNRSGLSTTVQQPEQYFIRNGKISLNTTIYPKENAESIILLHGGPGVPDPMREVADELHKKFQVLTFEQRGTGFSKCPTDEYAIKDYISDIDAITGHFQLSSFHLFGHSWGGLYAQIYAQENPSRIKSLFLCSPGSGTNQTWKITEKEVMKFNQQITSNLEWLKMGWNSLLGMFGSDRAYQKVFQQVLENYHKGYQEVAVSAEQLNGIQARPINDTRKNILSYKPLSKVEAPPFQIAITYGDNDIYGLSKQAVIDRFPTAEIIEIEKSGHIPWIHNAKRFNEVLARFYSIC